MGKSTHKYSGIWQGKTAVVRAREKRDEVINDALSILNQLGYLIPEMHITHQVQIKNFIKKYSIDANRN